MSLNIQKELSPRDIVRRLVFETKEAKLTKASEIMSSPLISLNDDADIYDAALVVSEYSIGDFLI
jgi:predicted transcriptional regulator